MIWYELGKLQSIFNWYNFIHGSMDCQYPVVNSIKITKPNILENTVILQKATKNKWHDKLELSQDVWRQGSMVCSLNCLWPGMLLFSCSSSIQGKKGPKQYLLTIDISWKNISTVCGNEYFAISDLHSCWINKQAARVSVVNRSFKLSSVTRYSNFPATRQ